MKLKKTNINDLYLLQPKINFDNRGYFVRIHENKFNLKFYPEYMSLSKNIYKGTIRGLHFQKKPFEEEKLVTCIKGAIFDVVIDLRKKSKTYRKIFTVNLNSKNYNSIIIPKGCAHGFQTLENDTSVLYSINGKYNRKAESGIRWNDAYFKIKWPLPISKINRKDKKYTDFVYEK